MSDRGAPAEARALFNVLGPLEVRTATCSPDLYGKPAALLSILLLNANSWVSTDEIVDALWEQHPPVSASRNVKTYVWQLRRWLPATADGHDRLESRRGGYRLAVDASELDVTLLERAVRHGALDSSPEQSAARLGAALELWRGDPYQELPTEVTRVQTARLEQVRWELHEQLADALAAAGRYTEVVVGLQPLVAEDPLREGLWSRMILALARAGRRGEALSCYQRARRLLLEELGVDPGPALQEAQRFALASESPASHSAPARTATARQVTGVRPSRPNFLPRDIPDFVGREHEMDAMLRTGRDNHGATRIAVVEGMPGVGKSALALHAAHALTADYPDGQVYCDLRAHRGDRRAVDPHEVLGDLLTGFGVAAELIPNDLRQRAATWRSLLSDRRVLLVLDDAADVDQVEPLLPGGSGCLVLITSRRRMAELDGVCTVALEPLAEAAALELLSKAVADGRPTLDKEASLATIRLCGNLPMAIRIAASRLRQHPAWTVEFMAQRLAREGARLAELRTCDRDLAATVTASYAQLACTAQRVFRILAVASKGSAVREFDIDETARLAGLRGEEAEHLLEQLLDRYLVSQGPHEQYRMHPVLQEYGRQVASSEDNVKTRHIAALSRPVRRCEERDAVPVARTA